MSIDIERLKVDADYWMECDPSYGEATHYEPIYADHEVAWVRIFNGERHYFSNYGWVNADSVGDDMGDIETMVSRPTKQSQEWDGGLPSLGFTEKQVSILGLDESDTFEVIAHKDGKAVVYFNKSPAGVTLCEPGEFRPVRTKEQQEQDKLACLIEEFQEEQGSFFTPHGLACEIIAEYELKERNS